MVKTEPEDFHSKAMRCGRVLEREGQASLLPLWSPCYLNYTDVLACELTHLILFLFSQLQFCWRWTGYNFGVDLLVSYTGRWAFVMLISLDKMCINYPSSSPILFQVDSLQEEHSESELSLLSQSEWNSKHHVWVSMLSSADGGSFSVFSSICITYVSIICMISLCLMMICLCICCTAFVRKLMEINASCLAVWRWLLSISLDRPRMRKQVVWSQWFSARMRWVRLLGFFIMGRTEGSMYSFCSKIRFQCACSFVHYFLIDRSLASPIMVLSNGLPVIPDFLIAWNFIVDGLDTVIPHL